MTDRKFDRRVSILRRPGDDDPSLVAVDDRYGNPSDVPGYVVGDDDRPLVCPAAYQSVTIASGEPTEPGGRDTGSVTWDVFVESPATIRRLDVLVEHEDCHDVTSPVVHRFEVRVVDEISRFAGPASHWEIRAVEYT